MPKQSHFKLIDGERYKSCTRCGEYFPATRTFFYAQELTLSCWCKACHAEWRQEFNAVAPCAEPGCNNPRHQGKSGRWYQNCTQHMREKNRRRYHARKAKAQS